MSMRTAQSPRKLYTRSPKNGGPLVLMIASVYYGPRKGEKTAFDPKLEVTTEELKASGGKKRLKVTQLAEGKDPVVETWVERELTFKKREPKATGLLDAAPAVEVSPAEGVIDLS